MTPEQPELDLGRVGADYGWFHVMRPRLMAGMIAEIGESAWAVYTVIKAHANHHTGRSDPSQERIAQLIGRTPETVRQAVKKLVAAGLVTRAKRGRHNEYQLMEEAPLQDRLSGASVGSADFPYVPAEFAEQIKALKNFLAEGIPPQSGLTLNLTVNLIQQRDGGTVNVQNINVGPGTSSADMRELARKFKLLNS